MAKLKRITLVIACLLMWACEEPAPVNTPAQVRSIECVTTSLSLDNGGSGEVRFVVKDAKAVFNYIVSTIGCQVELRQNNHLSQKPAEFSLTRVREGSTKGEYIATITDNGTGRIYSQQVCIIIKLESGALIRSNAVNVVSNGFVGGIVDIRLNRSDNPSLYSDVIFDYDSTTRTYHAHIDKYISERSFIPTISTEGIDRITINGNNYAAGNSLDFNHDITIVAWQGNSSTDYTLHLTCFTGLPVVRIETPGRQGVWSKERWVEGSRLWLDGMGRFDNIVDVEMAIRGRGNSTWGYEKKPYNIKFTEKQRVMGMPKHKRWCLLANYMDRTLLRNRVAYYLAEQTSLAWTPHCEFVELILNGEHLGQYLLCEQVRVDNDRIAITEMTPNDNAGDAITGGYLLELDFHYDNLWQWYTAHGVPFSVKFPDEEDLTQQQWEWIIEYIDEVERVLYGNNFKDSENGYAKYIDAQSFIDYWLIYELCVNHELANPGSVYLSKDRNGKLVAGPVWDFDWGTFSWAASPQAQWGLFMTHAWWYNRLFDDPAFKDLASQRWAELKPAFMTVFDFIEQEREYIFESWKRNFEIWSIGTNINGDEQLPFGTAIDRMEEILQTRIEILDRDL